MNDPTRWAPAITFDVGLDQATQHGDVAVESGRCTGGHGFPPQAVDEPIRRQHRVGLQGEHCEQGADLRPGHDDRRTGDDHLQAAEHSHLDATRRERRDHLAPLLPSLHRITLPPAQNVGLRPTLADVVAEGVYILEMRWIATIGLG